MEYLKESFKKQSGVLDFSSAIKDTRSGDFTTLRFVYTHLKDTFKISAGLELILFPRFPTNAWTLPQITDPTGPGFVTVHTTGEAKAALTIDRIPDVYKPHGITVHIIRASIMGEDLKAGEKLILIYGDTSGGGLGVKAPPLARKFYFPLFVRDVGQEMFRDVFSRLDDSKSISAVGEKADFLCSLNVYANKPHKLKVIAPSKIARGEKNNLKIVARDQFENMVQNIALKDVIIMKDNNLLTNQNKKKEPVLYAKDFDSKNDGYHKFTVIDKQREIMGVSNPFIEAGPNEEKIFWGEIHSHSNLSDGMGSAEESYINAKKNAGLDFAAITDHDWLLMADLKRWEYTKQVCKKFHEPGEFITLLGYELIPKFSTGHINIYFINEEEDVFFPESPEQLREFAQRKDILMIPHHTLYGWPRMGMDWKLIENIDEKVMPVVEIFSTHGCSEYFGCPGHVRWQKRGRGVQDALKHGARLGFIGGSDYHETLLGSDMKIQEDFTRNINNAHMQFRGGLTAIFSKELTRKTIFDAIRKRRTYATTGERIILDFRINGYQMGSVLPYEENRQKRKIKGIAIGTDKLRRVEIIKNNKILREFTPNSSEKEEFCFIEKTKANKGDFYYLRVTQENGERAWSSPLWC